MTAQITNSLDPLHLYVGDNGRIACGNPDCTASSAMTHTGYTLSGLRAERISPRLMKEWTADFGYTEGDISCEACGQTFADLKAKRIAGA